jgi:hypothetical protein
MFGCIHTPLFLLIGFDLNLLLDEFGAVDFDFVQNLAGKIECFLAFSTSHILYCWIEYVCFFNK